MQTQTRTVSKHRSKMRRMSNPLVEPKKKIQKPSVPPPHKPPAPPSPPPPEKRNVKTTQCGRLGANHPKHHYLSAVQAL